MFKKNPELRNSESVKLNQMENLKWEMFSRKP